MSLTEFEQVRWKELEKYEEQYRSYQATDFEKTFEKWMESAIDSLSPELRSRFFGKLDSWLFHAHAIMQGTRSQMDARNRILQSAKIFNEEVMEIQDLKKLNLHQLTYLADHQLAKHRLYSLAQGGISGVGGLLTSSIDIPAIILINLRSVQLISMTYGYDVNRPLEMMTSLRVFHAAMLPKRLQAHAMSQLKTDLRQYENQSYFYEGAEELTDQTWLEQLLKQAVKLICIQIFRKKVIQGIPLISMAIGASVNYQLTRDVTEFAHNFYQYRYLDEKKDGSYEYD